MAEDGRTLRYMPALDGVRAVALVAILLFHGGVSWVPGGFLALDVFFVLSGYLITALVLRERALTGTIDLGRFYLRRLRRLLPAVLVLLAVVAVATPFLVEPVQRTTIRGDALSALAYVANWRFILSDQSYFAGTPSPLRHLWSLSLEEQWYLLFPPVVLMVLRRARRIRLFVIGLAVAAVASAVWMAIVAAGAHDTSRAYYGTDTRAQSILVGALLAAVAAQWPIHRARRLLGAALAVGTLVIVAAFLLVSELDAYMYRGGFLVIALASAGVIAGVALLHPLPGVARIIELPPLVAIGRASYGMYLWHWPVDVVLTPDRTGLDGGGWETDLALLVVRTAVAAGCAAASYHLIEVPVRRGGLDGIRLRLPGPARSGPATAFGCVALVVWLLVAATVRVGPVPPSADLEAARVGVRDDIAAVTTVPPGEQIAVADGGLPPVPDDERVEVLVVGDSVAWSLAVDGESPAPPVGVRTRALIGCGLVTGLPIVKGRPDPIGGLCEGWEQEWQDGAVDGDPDVVVMMYGPWEVYDYDQDGRIIRSGTPEMAAEIRDALERGTRAVLAVNPDLRFEIIGSPCIRPVDPELGPAGVDAERLDPERMAWVNEQLRLFADSLGPRAAYHDLGELLCPNGDFREEIDGVEIRPDGFHYGPGTTRWTWDWISERVIDLARTPVPADEVVVPPPVASAEVPEAG